MAIFGKKKGDDGGLGDAPKTGKATGFQPDPAKAERWFQHARVSHDSTNYEYAMTCWLKGLGCDPANKEALESFAASAQQFNAGRAKPGPSKDQAKAFDGKGPVGKFLVLLLQWGCKPADTAAAIKVVEAAGKLQLREASEWLGGLALRAGRGDPKRKKDQFVKLFEVFEAAELWELATKAGEDALTFDRSDGALADRVKQVSAKAAMTSGGYDQTGAEGGFRSNIKDADAQEKIRQQQQVVKSEDLAEEALAEAKQDFESRPDDRNAIYKYVRALLQRGEAADEKLARDVLQKSYEQFKEERMREQAADIELKWSKRKLAKLKKAAEADATNADARAAFEQGQREHVQREADEFRARVAAYPTETSYKYELGRRLFALEQYEDAITFLQDAQNDAKRRVAVLSLLGQSFQKLGWHNEAIGMLRQASEAHHSTDDGLALDLRYGLMEALQSKASEERDADAADEAMKIASAIAMKQIGFRDVRARRDALKTLAAELRS